MIKFFYEGAYAPHLEKPALARWMNERAQSQAVSGGKVLPGKRIVDPASTDSRITTAIFHIAMYGLGLRYSIAGLKEEAKDATVACLKELSTLEILEHCVPEVYSSISSSSGDDSEFRKAVTGVMMDKLVYQSPKEEKARISSVNEAMVDGFPLYEKDLEARVLDRENKITEMRAEVGFSWTGLWAGHASASKAGHFCTGIVRNNFNWTGSINKAIQNKKEEENTAQVF